jgi:hypothetical protein
MITSFRLHVVGSAPVGDVGGPFFDVADRLAVINLFGAYAYSYDENRLDEFRELFTESPELLLQHDGHNLSGDIDAVMSCSQERIVEGRKRPVAPPAELILVFRPKRRRDDRALLCPGLRYRGWRCALSGRYEFTAVKQHAVWRFSRWVVAIDQRQPRGAQ